MGIAEEAQVEDEFFFPDRVPISIQFPEGPTQQQLCFERGALPAPELTLYSEVVESPKKGQRVKSSSVASAHWSIDPAIIGVFVCQFRS